jgi:hypothetical protein
MDIIEDAAGLRRNLHVYTEVSAKDFLDYAIKKDFHPFVIEYIQTHPERVYDFQSQKTGAVYANPASWEKISDHLWKMQIAHGKIDFNKFEAKAAGLINTSMTRLFLEFARDKKDINPKDIFHNFPKIEKQIKELIKNNDNSKLGELMTSFNTYLQNSMPNLSGKEIQNIHDFLISMPVDTASLLIIQSDIDRRSPEFRYMTKLMKELYKSPTFQKKFFEKLRNPNK